MYIPIKVYETNKLIHSFLEMVDYALKKYTVVLKPQI